MATYGQSRRCIRRGARSKSRGLALAMVLWVVVVMTALVAITGQTSRLDFKMATGALDDVRCKWACRAGVETAVALLVEDLRDTDCLLDPWCDNDTDYNDVQLERCMYSVRVTDEAGRLNVNTATKEQLMALPYMEENIADAIIDWRDTDDNPSTEGAEAGYYENLPFPYTIRNNPFKTVRELLQVKGMTESLLYGEDTNLNGRLDSNEMDGDLSPPVDNGDDYLDQGWIAYLTCYSYERNTDWEGNARVNINQADERQLESALGIKSTQARWIVQNRGQGYRSIADIIGTDNRQQQGQSGNSGGNQQGQGNQNNQGNQGNPPNQGNQQAAEPIDLQTFGQIADRITIAGEDRIPGKININTASWEVLSVLFGGNDQAEQIAHAVASERSSLLYGFESIADLANVQSVGFDRFKRVADRITVRSDVFTICCLAAADISGAKLRMECVVDRSQTPCSILYWYQGANY